MTKVLKPSSVRWGLAQLRQIIREDSCTVVMVDAVELNALLELALGRVRPRQELLGYFSAVQGLSLADNVACYSAGCTLRIPQTAKEAREHAEHGSKFYRLFAEELESNARS